LSSAKKAPTNNHSLNKWNTLIGLLHAYDNLKAPSFPWQLGYHAGTDPEQHNLRKDSK